MKNLGGHYGHADPHLTLIAVRQMPLTFPFSCSHLVQLTACEGQLFFLVFKMLL